MFYHGTDGYSKKQIYRKIGSVPNILVSFDKPAIKYKNYTKHIDTFLVAKNIGFDREKWHEKINKNVFK